MLMQSPRSRLQGFTLIELMITIVVAAIVLAAALPMYTVWTQNAHIRNAAESVLNGIQRARAEAVVRNTSVAFVLGGGAFWTVGVVNGDVIESRPSGEVSPRVSMAIFPADDPAPTTVTFNNLGTVIANNDASNSITQINFDSTSLSAEESRNLTIVVGIGGGARMCDPNVSNSTDPRHC